ncbi:MBG domain-containing protein, partial [Selenomonas sp.]|uniref:MBG domain-containing protein n=1 Tax=Selenomonas sp. TaxID=2053611 RepID=UPI003FA206EF
DSRATVTTDAGTAGLKTKIANAVFGTGNAANYDISYEDGSFAITPRDLTLRAGDKTRIYGTENSTAVYTGGTSKFRADAATATTGLANGDTIADVDESTNATVRTNVGAGGLKTQITNATFRAGKASNYNIHYVDGGFAITQRDLYIRGGDKSRAYGAANGTAHYVNGTSRLNVRHADATTGLVNGDTISSVTETIDPLATVTTDAGTPNLRTRVSDAQFGSGLASNYAIHYADGSFAIVPREVLVTAGNAVRDYGAPNPVVTEYTVERGDHTSERGLLAGDDLTGVATYYDAAITPQTAGGTYAGVIHINPASVAAGYTGATTLSNYRFRYAPGALTIKVRGFDMSTPEGRAVTTGSTAASQIIAGLGGSHIGSHSSATGGIGSVGTSAGGTSSFGGTSTGSGSAPGISGTSTRGGTISGGKSTGSTSGAGSASRAGGAAAGVPTSEQPRDTTFADGVNVTMPQDMAATSWQSRVVVTAGGASEAHDYVEGADGSFGFDLARTRGNYGIHDEIPGGTAEAIPVLFTDGVSRDLDGIYSVNYGSGKLAIKPASKKVEIPDPKEIRKTAEQTLRFLYQTQNGSYEVTFGNGIVTLYPQDDAALAIITGDDKKAERAVLASGLLTAVEDLGVTPVEIRAVYVFKTMDESAK